MSTFDSLHNNFLFISEAYEYITIKSFVDVQRNAASKMGGSEVTAQSFGIYQAIEWLCNDGTSVENQIKGVVRIRKMIEQCKNDDFVELNIISRLVERLEKTTSVRLQVSKYMFHSLTGSSLIYLY